MQIYNIITGFFLDLFFPKRCVGCGKADFFLCYECSTQIEIIRTAICADCGKINKYGQFCSSCKKRLNTNLSGLIIGAEYDAGPLKELIHHLKYSGITELVPILSELIYERIKNKLPTGDKVVVPVPLYRKRKAQRGYNQSELIARYLSKKLKLPGGDVLIRVKDTQTQVGLSRNERKLNLKGAFVCEDDDFVRNKVVLLIDDVATTYSTLNECSMILKEAGARQIYGVVVAKRI